MPFPDASFDVVLSTFGVMFAPCHGIAAAELARVLRPGGRLGVCSWTPEGSQGRLFRAMAGYVPPAPDSAQPPLLWGNEDHVCGLFAGTGVRLEFDRELAAAPRYPTGYEAVDFGAANFGPLMMLHRRLTATGEWDGVRDMLARLYEDSDQPEYLVATGRKE